MLVYKYKKTELYYEEMGQGVPFLLIHGWAIDHRFLENALEPAFLRTEGEKKIRRIYVDVPGMGASVPGEVRNGDDIVEVLLAFMDEIAPNEKFYVGGNSFGAALSRAIIAKCPQRVLGAMLIVPASKFDAMVVSKEGVYKKDEEFLKTLPIPKRAAFTIMNANLTKECFERYERDAYPSVEANRDNEFLRRTLKGSFSFDVDKALERVKFNGPVLILTAKYDTAVGYTGQFEWLRFFPHATYVLIDGAGHNVNIDQPEMFVHTVTGWLDCILHEDMI